MGFFQREPLIPRLCRESGRWLMFARQGDRYWVQATDQKSIVDICVRDTGSTPSVLFQTWFPVRFSLEKPPSGLFARLLERNLDLHFTAWGMAIGNSCEACLTVAGRAPRAVLGAALFDVVCGEIRDEINGFQGELHEKFRYSMGTPVANPVVSARVVSDPGIRYLDGAAPGSALPTLPRAGGKR